MNMLLGFLSGFLLMPWIALNIYFAVYIGERLGIYEYQFFSGFFTFIAVLILVLVGSYMRYHG
mgnify:CR=1 FL=1